MMQCACGLIAPVPTMAEHISKTNHAKAKVLHGNHPAAIGEECPRCRQ